MWPAPRHPEDRKPVEPEGVGELSDVTRPVEQLSVRLKIGSAVTRAVDNDEADAGRFGGLSTKTFEARMRCPAEPEHGVAYARTEVLVAERTAVAELDRRGHGRNVARLEVPYEGLLADRWTIPQRGSNGGQTEAGVARPRR